MDLEDLVEDDDSEGLEADELMFALAGAVEPVVLNNHEGETIAGICVAFKGYRADGTDPSERRVGVMMLVADADRLIEEIGRAKQIIEERF